MTSSWTEQKTSDGRTFYYDRVSSRSVWERPKDFQAARHKRVTMEECLDESPQVASLFNAVLRHCGSAAVPTVRVRTGEGDPLCEGGRGGAFCCKSNTIHLCTHGWVGCRELAYELSHALNTCRGLVHCTPQGMQIDGTDCGYLGPPDVACSELRASYWTGRCADRGEGASLRACMEWHARWATASCFPRDEHLEAHVRWARHRCTPTGDDQRLTQRPDLPRSPTCVPCRVHSWSHALYSYTAHLPHIHVLSAQCTHGAATHHMCSRCRGSHRACSVLSVCIPCMCTWGMPSMHMHSVLSACIPCAH